MFSREEEWARCLRESLSFQDNRRGGRGRLVWIINYERLATFGVWNRMVGLLTSALLFIGPSYVANAAPLLFGGGPTLDGGRKIYDGWAIICSRQSSGVAL